MTENSIQIQVQLDENKMPAEISWSAPDNTPENTRKAKAFLLSLWDGSDKAALRIDLWTKDMMVDEMADFYYQTFMTMAETFQRATQDQILVNDMKQFAKDFYSKFREHQLKTNKI